MNGMYKTQASCYFTWGLQCHNMELQVQFSTLRSEKNIFSNTAIALWNTLPDNIVQAATLDAFKRLRVDLPELAK